MTPEIRGIIGYHSYRVMRIKMWDIPIDGAILRLDQKSPFSNSRTRRWVAKAQDTIVDTGR
jgi:hypothetical protein